LKRVRPFADKAKFGAVAGYSVPAIKAGKLTKWQRYKLRRYSRVIQNARNTSHKIVRMDDPKKLRALVKHTGVRPLRDLKVAFIATPQPDKTTVKVDKQNAVHEYRSGIEQRFFYAEPSAVNRPGGALKEARRLIAGMPVGQYYILTGVREAYQTGIARDLLVDEIKRWNGLYGADRVQAFFRGFRWIGRSSAAETQRYARATEKMRKQRAKEKYARRKDLHKRITGK